MMVKEMKKSQQHNSTENWRLFFWTQTLIVGAKVLMKIIKQQMTIAWRTFDP